MQRIPIWIHLFIIDVVDEHELSSRVIKYEMKTYLFYLFFSKDTQLIGLEKRFETQKYLSTPDRIELADMLHLSQLQVKTWY